MSARAWLQQVLAKTAEAKTEKSFDPWGWWSRQVRSRWGRQPVDWQDHPKDIPPSWLRPLHEQGSTLWWWKKILGLNPPKPPMQSPAPASASAPTKSDWLRDAGKFVQDAGEFVQKHPGELAAGVGGGLALYSLWHLLRKRKNTPGEES